MFVSFLPLGLTLLLTIPGAAPLDVRQIGNAPELQQSARQRPFRVRRTTPNQRDSDGRPVPALRRSERANEPRNAPSADRAPRPARIVGRKSVVLRLQHVPAVDTSKLLQQWLEKLQAKTDQLVADVIPDAITNSLLIRGTEEQLEEIHSILGQLDQPQPQIRLKTLLAEVALPEPPEDGAGATAAYRVSDGDLNQVIQELRERGELRVLARPELLVVDNQPAFLQIGQRVPRITGRANSRGSVSNTIQLENVGTLIGVTCRVTDQGSIIMEIDLERSHLGPEDEGTPLSVEPDGGEIRMPVIHSVNLQTTVTLKSEEIALIGGTVYQTEHGWREFVMLVRAEITR